MTKGFIFDMDGVIIDSEPLYLENVKQILADLDTPITHKELFTYVGISSHEMWQIIKQRHSLPQDVDWLVNREQHQVVETFQQVDNLTPMTGIRQLIKFLQQNNFNLGLASSSPRRIIELILHKLQLFDYFNVTVSGEEVKHGKPHPEIFLTCAARLGLKPEQCIVLEDSSPGIAGAKSAKMTTIGFANPNSGNQDLSQADYHTASLDGQLMDFIRRAL
jgi:beta-phosphoglucomutase family hydrolase